MISRIISVESEQEKSEGLRNNHDMDFKKVLRDYFEFYPSEKKAVFALSVIIAVWIAGLYVYKQMPVKYEKDEEIERVLAEFYRFDQSESGQARTSSLESIEERAWNLFPFDPNTISSDSLRLLGLPENTVRAISNYRKSGGRFYELNDLARIYTLSDSDFNVISPYVEIADLPTNRTKKENHRFTEVDEVLLDSVGKSSVNQKSFYNSEHLVLELNLADSSELIKIRGIGKYFARKIVERRIALGGYLNYNQLTEIYRFDEELLEQVAGNLVLDTTLVRRININRAGIDELKAHPYISYKVANSIVQMRNSHGLYQSVSDIRRSYLVNDSIFDRIKPYLTIDD